MLDNRMNLTFPPSESERQWRGRRLAWLSLLTGLSLTLVWAVLLHSQRVVAAPQDSATITLSPSPATLDGCQTAQLEIWVNSAANLYGLDVQLAFDPAALEVVDANSGQTGIQIQPLYTFFNPGFFARNTADNSAGTIWFAATQLSPSLPVTGSGPIAVITFRGKAAGSLPITITSSMLSDRDGNMLPATDVNGSLNSIAPLSSALAIAKANSTDARLTWNAATGVASYRIYRGTAPYFTPTDPPYATTTGLIYTDTNVLGNTTTNYYYVIRSACDTGFQSDNSNRVGEFDFAITRNAYNTIALPLIDPSLATADQLGNAINATKISRWIPDTQLLGTRIVGVTGTNFGLGVGQGYFVYTPGAGATALTVVGSVPAAGSLSFTITRASSCKLNLLSLPLDQDTITSADTLAGVIGGVPTIKEWRSVTNVFATRVVGVVGNNFVTRIGYPYWPCADITGGGPTWP